MTAISGGMKERIQSWNQWCICSLTIVGFRRIAVFDQLITQEVMSYTIIDEVNESIAETMSTL